MVGHLSVMWRESFYDFQIDCFTWKVTRKMDYLETAFDDDATAGQPPLAQK